MITLTALASINAMQKDDEYRAHHHMIKNIIEIIQNRESKETDAQILNSIESVINEMDSRYWNYID